MKQKAKQREYRRRYFEKNQQKRDESREYHREYYKKHKEDIALKRKEKNKYFNCEHCGKEIREDSKTNHYKTKTCIEAQQPNIKSVDNVE